MTLRTDEKNGHGDNSETEKRFPLIMIDDIPDAFKNANVSGVKRRLELIRKPNATDPLKIL